MQCNQQTNGNETPINLRIHLRLSDSSRDGQPDLLQTPREQASQIIPGPVQAQDMLQINDWIACQIWLSANAVVIDIGMESFNASKPEPDHNNVTPRSIPDKAPNARKRSWWRL